MKCPIDICEFYNMLISGIVLGVVASFLFVVLTDWIRICRFKKRYSHLKSKTESEFDWIAYSMREDDGRKRQDAPNGSKMNLQLDKDRIFIRVRQVDHRTSIGELTIDRFDYGIVTYKYENEHEYGKRECVIGSYEENSKQYDYLYLIPTNNRVYYVHEHTTKGQHLVKYHYGDELFLRKRVRR